jgi:phosphoserine phosphatase
MAWAPNPSEEAEVRVYGWAWGNIELGRRARGTARGVCVQLWLHVPVDRVEAVASWPSIFKKEEALCRWMHGAEWTWEVAS